MRKFILFTLLLSSTLLYGCQAIDAITDPKPVAPVAQESEPLPPLVTEVKQVSSPAELIKSHSERFRTLNEYQSLIADSRTNEKYKTAEPKNIVLVKPMPQEGTDFGGYELWANERWESEAEDAEQVFYIKNYSSQPYQEVEEITWFGPFRGELGRLSLSYSQLDQFETIQKYLGFITVDKSSDLLKTTEPKNVIRIKEVTSEETGSDLYELWGRQGWNLENKERVQTFYIKGTFSEPNKEVAWFGPFNGKLGLLAL